MHVFSLMYVIKDIESEDWWKIVTHNVTLITRKQHNVVLQK